MLRDEQGSGKWKRWGGEKAGAAAGEGKEMQEVVVGEVRNRHVGERRRLTRDQRDQGEAKAVMVLCAGSRARQEGRRQEGMVQGKMEKGRRNNKGGGGCWVKWRADRKAEGGGGWRRS